MNAKKDINTIKWVIGISGSGLIWPVLLTVIRFLQGYTCILYAYGMGTVIDCASAGDADGFRRTFLRFIVLVVFTLFLQTAGRYTAEKGKTVLEGKFRLQNTLDPKRHAKKLVFCSNKCDFFPQFPK